MAARKKATETKKTAEVKTAKTTTIPASEKKVPVESKEEIIAEPVKEIQVTETPAAAEEKPAEGKKPAAKKTAAKKPAAKKTPVKKEAEEKPQAEVKAKKPAAKKTEVKTAVHLQFAGKSYSTEDLIKSVKDIWKYDLKKKAGDFKSVELYVKPEENAVYYVVNGDITGSFHI